MNDIRAFSNDSLSKDPFQTMEKGGEIVLFDLEFTAWEGSQERDWSEPWEHREIIQIGAIRVKDDPKLSETDRLLCYVSPTRNGILSDYIIALTGIEQRMLDEEGFGFPEAYDIFMAFCEGAGSILSFSGDPEVLAENCLLNDIPMPDYRRFGNIRPALGTRVGPEFLKASSFQLPDMVGLEPIGQAHDALDDTDAILIALRALRDRGVV